MTEQPPPPAGWYPEPNSPTGQRYWDGAGWTEQVQPPAPDTAAAGPGDGPKAAMLAVPVVQIEQAARVMEASSVYQLSGPGGLQVGQAVQVGQQRGARLLKAMSDMDRNLPVTVEFQDAAGAVVMTLTKPGGVGPQRFVVTDAAGGEIGQINQKIRMVREAFDVVLAGRPAGVLASENWYDRRFSVLDGQGQAYARVHKLYEGYARAAFTSADKYVVEFVDTATRPQRALALAAAIAMDIALYQR